MVAKKNSKSAGAAPSAKKRATSSASTHAVVETTFTEGSPIDSRQRKKPSSTARRPTKRVQFAAADDDDGAARIPADFPESNPASGAKAAALAKRRGLVGISAGSSAGKRPRAADDDAKDEKKDEKENGPPSRRRAEKAGKGGNAARGRALEATPAPAGASPAAVDDSSDDDDFSDAGENPFVKARRTGGRLAYAALHLRFLPPEFEEPQLFKFLGQFGAAVLNCFCVRSRRTHRSKGIAYVQFDRESILPTVVEECHGMLLGGRTVQAKIVVLHRALPSKESVSRRRRLAYAYRTKGAPLKRHSVARKDAVGVLIKAARTERANNAYLKSLGIDYATDFFTTQLANLPAHRIDPTKKPRGVKFAARPTANEGENEERETEKEAPVVSEETTGSDSPAKAEIAKGGDPNKKAGRRGDSKGVSKKKGSVGKNKELKKGKKPAKRANASKK